MARGSIAAVTDKQCFEVMREREAGKWKMMKEVEEEGGEEMNIQHPHPASTRVPECGRSLRQEFGFHILRVTLKWKQGDVSILKLLVQTRAARQDGALILLRQRFCRSCVAPT